MIFSFWLSFLYFGGVINKTIIPLALVRYIEDVTRWREDMNFKFEWQKQYITSEHSERVRYCFCHENIKFISSS